MQSALFEGMVQHRRFSPLLHRFRYRMWMVYLDLAELNEVWRGRWLWSTSRMAAVRFRRSDHLGDPRIPLDTAVRDLVELRTGRRPTGPVRLLTQLRHFGYVMNPVCFYYCFKTDGETVDAVVAEVTNTPWRERHCYVLPFDAAKSGVLRCSQGKEFHVSPFMGMHQCYRWRVETPRNRLSVHIENIEAGLKLFDATLVLRRREMSGWHLTRLFIFSPLMSFRIISGIYWQAFRLWWKKCPVFPHPGTSPNQELTSS